jgi:hypothetical protein
MAARALFGSTQIGTHDVLGCRHLDWTAMFGSSPQQRAEYWADGVDDECLVDKIVQGNARMSELGSREERLAVSICGPVCLRQPPSTQTLRNRRSVPRGDVWNALMSSRIEEDRTDFVRHRKWSHGSRAWFGRVIDVA